jgi:hypothetical protein
MMRRLCSISVVGVVALAMSLSASVARANDAPTTKGQANDADETAKKTSKNTDHANPELKTLPSHASATAKKNAFGQQGAREKAAHRAAKAAAVADGHKAAGQPDNDTRSQGAAHRSQQGAQHAQSGSSTGTTQTPGSAAAANSNSHANANAGSRGATASAGGQQNATAHR